MDIDAGPDDLRKVEALYAADRELQALQMLDRLLGMPTGFEAQLHHLRQLRSDPDAVSIDTPQLPAAGKLAQLLALRSKCLASGGIRFEGEIAQAARDHVRLLDALCAGQAGIEIDAAQIAGLLGDAEDGLRRIEAVLQRDPGDRRAAGTRELLRRKAAADAVALVLQRLGELTRHADRIGGHMTADLAVPWLSLLSELAQHLARHAADARAWSHLLMHLMNGHLYAEAAVAMRALQDNASSPATAVDAFLGPGATQRMLAELEPYARPDDDSVPRRPAPAERAASISDAIRRHVADMSATVVAHWLPRLLEVIDGTGELSESDEASLRFVLIACEARPIVSERHFLELALLAAAIGRREAAVAALRRAVECKGRRAPSRDEDVLGFMAQSLISRA